MRLRPKHIAGLTPAELRAYAPLIGRVDFAGERRTRFIAQSLRYVDGDERVLPFPERSRAGVMLFSLCQHLATARAALVLDACVPQNVLHVKRKLLALGAAKVYAVPAEHLLACVYGAGENPFEFWRRGAPLALPQLAGAAPVLCALDPPLTTIQDTLEWTVRGALLNPPPAAADIAMDPYFKEVAHLGLTEVTSVNAKVWVTREAS